MDIYQAIHQDHVQIDDLLEKLEAGSQRALQTRRKLFDRLRQEIRAHQDVEEKLFYPLLLAEPALRPQALEAIEEHNVMAVVIKDIEETPFSDERWKPKLSVLRELFEHHIEEEEEDLFISAQDLLDDEEAADFAAQFLAVKAADRKSPAPPAAVPFPPMDLSEKIAPPMLEGTLGCFRHTRNNT